MPPVLSTLPMSLWNLCLEIHTGRIYTILGKGTLIYIFFAGLIVGWILWTGVMARQKRTISSSTNLSCSDSLAMLFLG
jgi:hypothetical protein